MENVVLVEAKRVSLATANRRLERALVLFEAVTEFSLSLAVTPPPRNLARPHWRCAAL